MTFLAVEYSKTFYFGISKCSFSNDNLLLTFCTSMFVSFGRCSREFENSVFMEIDT